MNKFTPILSGMLVCGIFCLDSGAAEASVIQCQDESCFIEQAADCNKNTSFLTPEFAGAQVRYSIMGAYKGRCDIRMSYTQHPDPEWVGLSLGFVIDPGGDIDAQIKLAVAGCLEGNGEQWLCEGPLFNKVTGVTEETPEGFAEPVAATSPPCGVDVVDDGPPLYPMLENGKWGYVTRDGEWAIEPRWFRAEPFSEGRAAVNKDGRWGIIDREGKYVLGPVLRASTSNAPIQPFSQGCSTAEAQQDGSPHAFFVDRAGQFWLYDELPEEISDKNVWEFGNFSGGRVWFRAIGEKHEESFGWIDSQGKVVLRDEFSGAGEFVNGLAPAAKGGRYSWAYIDTEGNPVMPTKWKYQKARAFSEGLALVTIDVFHSMYFSTEGAIAIDRVSLKVPREVNGKLLSEVEIQAAGDFHDGLAPVLPAKMFSAQELIYIRSDGTEAFAPGTELGVVVCRSRIHFPEFHDGLLQLLIADDGEECIGADQENKLIKAGKARYVYLDTSGKIVLQQKETK